MMIRQIQLGKRHNCWTSLGLSRASLLLFLLLGSAEYVHAENWSRFRGPNGSGDAGEVTFPSTWTDQDYRWKIALPGIGHSSPVGWGNRLFVTSGDVETGAVTLHCFATGSGESLWEKSFVGEKYVMHASNSYASTSPTVDEQHVYLSWASAGKMHCAALTHEGEHVWREELGDFVGPHGFAASPMAAAGVLCMQIDQEDGGFLVGIDKATGKVRWRARRPAGKASYATPCVISLGDSGSAVISQSMTSGMQAIDVETGQQLWQLDDVFPARCVSSPFLAGKTIFGVCGGGGTGKVLVGIQLHDDPRQQPIEKLTLTKHVPYVPTPLIKGDLLFLWHDQGKVSCVDLQSDNPRKMLWTERIGGKFFGSPILAGEKIYCLSMDGRVVVLAADREFALLGENDLGQPSSATPAVHHGKMYLRTESTLACLPAE